MYLIKKTFYFLLFFLTVFACSGGGSSDGPAHSLQGNTFTVLGLEEVSAIATDCLDGGTGDLAAEPEDVDVTILFQDGFYSMAIDGESGLGNWSIVDSDTITLQTTNDATVEVDVTISGTNLTLTLTDEWVTDHCTGTA